MTDRHPVLVRATGQPERSGFTEATEHAFHHRLGSYRSDIGGVSITELMLALTHLDNVLTHPGLYPLSVVERAETVADFEDIAYLIGTLSHHVSAWAVVTTYDPKGTFAPGRDVTWSGHFDKADADAACIRWDKHLKRPNDNIRVEWRDDLRVRHIKTSDWKGPYR